MKVIIHADADDLIFGIRAAIAALVSDRTEACIRYGDDDDAPTGSWTVWVQRADAIQVVAP